MAARVASQLRGENDLQIQAVAGGLGEFSVFLDGQEAITTNRLWYPRPGKVVARVRELLAKK
jgi:hypothetical protein